jgi:hypothetical protein
MGGMVIGVMDVRINEIPPLLVKVIQNLKRRLLVALAHELDPRVAKVHGAEA